MRGRAATTALVPVATGSEEMEAVIVIDVLRRAGVDVCVASIEDSKMVCCSRSVNIMADELLGDVSENFDAIVLPGGMPGAERLRDSSKLIDMLKVQQKEGRIYGAICAAPAIVFQPNGLLDGKVATCHPGFMEGLENASEKRVVVQDNCITSRGPGTAFEFALALVKELLGEEKAEEVANPMVL